MLTRPMGLQAPKRDKVLEAILRAQVQSCPFDRVGAAYEYVLTVHGDRGRAALGRVDRFFLLTVLLHRPDAIHPWLYERCREVEARPDGCLDLWAREHYKSTIITFAGAIQENIRDPEITIGIFSHTKPTAKKFFTQIKEELETNRDLQRVYPDIFHESPKRDASRWSEDKGIVVKRTGNPKESTVEAHGLVDGQPTGAHFALRIYDDVVTLESVTSPEMVKKTTEAFHISDNLGARGADGIKRRWIVGTRYKFGDTYQDIIDRKSAFVRLYAATDNALPDGNPVFLTPQALAEIKRDQPSAIFAAQQLMNPAAGLEAMFQVKWLRYADIRPATLTVYIMCDPASSRKKGRDNTAIYVIGMDAGRNLYLLDGYSHKMGLSERWTHLRDLFGKWSSMPGVQGVKVGYERYGLLDALEYFNERMLVEKVSFPIIELAWVSEGGNSKYDRIQRLEPITRARRFYLSAEAFREEALVDAEGKPMLGPDEQPMTKRVKIEETRNQRIVKEQGQPYRVFQPVVRMDHEGNLYSLNKCFIDQYQRYPYVNHDDDLDCVSRIFDMEPAPPVVLEQMLLEPEVFVDS
jgi:hypothetical protein